jgi:hypothetical protein
MAEQNQKNQNDKMNPSRQADEQKQKEGQRTREGHEKGKESAPRSTDDRSHAQ